MNARRSNLWLALALLLFVIGSSYTQAGSENSYEPDYSRIKSGSLFMRSAQGGAEFAPLLNTDVDLQVTGMIVRAKVLQHFQNPGEDWVEGIYLFPLPETAAVDHMRLRVGERIIEGVIKEKEEAKRVYNKAKRSGKRASLLTQERPNMFTVVVANIGPHETVQVEIEYQQAVYLDQGEFSVRFPMTVTPRYIPGSALLDATGLPQFSGSGTAPNTDAVPDASHITPAVSRLGENSNPINISVDLEPGFALETLESLYHHVRRDSGGPGNYRIYLESTGHDSNSDFVLRWRAAPSAAPYLGFYTQKWQGDYYSMLMLTPQMEGSSAREGSSTPDNLMPRDLVFVIDTSGSMGGEPVRQAKRALVMAIERLRPEDRFNLIEFNSVTRSLFNSVRPASQAMRARAISFAKALNAGGGTEMYRAIDTALTQNSSDQSRGGVRIRQVVFLTDGAVGDEDRLFELIQRKLDDSRLFTIGIGSAPNSHFMRKAAEFGRGSFTHIGSMKMVTERMNLLFRKLETPLLTDLKLSIPDKIEAELYPQKIPDLYQGEPVIVAFKSRYPPDEIRLTGSGETDRFSRTLKFDDAEQRVGVNVLWARRKIDTLMDRYLLSYDKERRSEIKEAVLDLSLLHHLVSRFTSLVAVDKTPVRRPSEPLSSHALKNNPPKGTKFGLPQTATDAELRILKGFLIWLLALCFYLYSRSRGIGWVRYGL